MRSGGETVKSAEGDSTFEKNPPIGEIFRRKILRAILIARNI